jgi:ABC-type sugar transport system ATPase subunit
MMPELFTIPGSHEMIHMRQVVKTFKNAAGEFRVLKGLDLTLKSGEFVAIVGKSGSGKSTLLNMITGIDFPTSGQVVVNGVDIHKMNESKRALWRGRNLGIVFQFFQLLPMLSLLENVMLPMDYVEMYDFDQRKNRPINFQWQSPPGSSKALRSPAPWQPIHLSSWRMNQPAILTRGLQPTSSICSTAWYTRARPSPW